MSFHRTTKANKRGSLQMFHNMFENCFTACVDDFTSKALSSRENGCISRCVQKTLATQQRLGERFQEHSQTTMMQQQQQQ